MSYSNRNDYLSSTDKIYSNDVQKTQAELALTEVAETLFAESLMSDKTRTEETDGTLQKRITSPKDKVGKSLNSDCQNTKPNKDYSLDFVFPGNCIEVQREIKDIFDEEMKKACNSSKVFKDCFSNCAIGALFRNEKKLGALISKSKL